LSENGNELSTILLGIHLGLFLAALIGCEVYLRIMRKREVSFEECQTVVTREEFEDRVAEGEQLVILDDLVLDVSLFKNEHPGGLFLFEHHIGMDISKFF